MKNNKGFTLSEVILTLGIIGVIAALSISALTKSTQKAHIGPSLAKFVGNFETAAYRVMQNEDISSLSENSDYVGEKKVENFVKSVGSSMQLIPMSANNNADSYVASGSISANGKKIYQTKEGFLVYALNNGWLMLDINGNKNPNRPGLDRFLFYLDNSGKLLPWGKSKLYYSRLEKELGESISSYSPDCDVKSEDAWKGYACTGTIADNGWKADY